MPEKVLANRVAEIADTHGFEIAAKVVLPERQSQLRPVPSNVYPEVRAALVLDFPEGLYSHQAEAISLAVDGKDVCVATSTASGKSLIFIASAVSELLRDPHRKVLALYPARALIQDQLEKWRTFAGRFGLEVGHIDGGVSTDRRKAILQRSHIVLMTPDVVQAWLLGGLGDEGLRAFLRQIFLLVLDEAHVYDGVFGTNMGFLLRRLLAVAGQVQLLVSTATVDNPQEFVRRLAGRDLQVLGSEHDGAGAPEKTVLLASGGRVRQFERTAALLHDLAAVNLGRFIAFADSRKTVEMMVAVMARMGGHDPDDEGDEGREPEGPAASFPDAEVLPYRAGYESEDREEIQRALAEGTLSGVVSTSALELGLDIGEISLVVMLNVPSSLKGFWQRMGRAGRKGAGSCLILDGDGAIVGTEKGLRGYLDRPLEPNWLYFDNRYIQYANALCAAHEMRAMSATPDSFEAFASLPGTFTAMVRNELDPTEAIPPDLYPLKQKALADPHHEFPLRSCMEQTFQVQGPMSMRLGSLTFPQVLREAYPGAIYHYMGRPYRVKQVQYRRGVIRVARSRRYTTQPISQAKVFPQFDGGVLSAFSDGNGFVAETEMQVSERVLGFVEKRGSARDEHRYEPGSIYSQRELNRFFETTGVCWYLPDGRGRGEAIGKAVKRSFCLEFGVQERELGVGSFYSKRTLTAGDPCEGVCVFDSTSGSLRLTQRLGENFEQVLDRAVELCRCEGEDGLAVDLECVLQAVGGMGPFAEGAGMTMPVGDEQEWVELVAGGETAMHWGPSGPEEVIVQGFRYTPQGLMYDLQPKVHNVRWSVRHETIRPLHGESRKVRYNLMTGEEKAV